jgi:hypothetical protein
LLLAIAIQLPAAMILPRSNEVHPETPSDVAGDEPALLPKQTPEQVQPSEGHQKKHADGDTTAAGTGPIAWMVRRSMALQGKLQVFFQWNANLVVTHPKRCVARGYLARLQCIAGLSDLPAAPL